jgi:hypothetical protein
MIAALSSADNSSPFRRPFSASEGSAWTFSEGRIFAAFAMTAALSLSLISTVFS